MTDYKAPLSKTLATVFSLAFSILMAFTRKITHIPTRRIINGIFGKAQEAAKALSDANPNDDEQMQAIANSLITSGDFYEGTRATLLANIDKIKPSPIKDVLLLGTDRVYVYADILTDEVKDNGEQAKQALAAWLKTEEGVKFFTALLDVALDETTANIIAAIIIEAIQAGIGPDDQSLMDRLQALKVKRQAQALEA